MLSTSPASGQPESTGSSLMPDLGTPSAGVPASAEGAAFEAAGAAALRPLPSAMEGRVRGDEGEAVLGWRADSSAWAPGSEFGGMIARRAELAGAEAVADEGGAEPGAAAAGTSSDTADDTGDSIGAGAVAASAAARAASVVRLWRESPRGAVPLVAFALERAATVSADGAFAFAPAARPERSAAVTSSPGLSSTVGGAASLLDLIGGMAPPEPGPALELGADAGRELPAPGRRVLGRNGAKG
jgi:hypothetical protein